MSEENLRAYQVIAPIYEKVMGYRDDVEFVQELIKEQHPCAQTLLELACGSGTMLRPLSRDYEVTGVDYSKGMLDLCRHSMVHGDFHLADMTKVRLKKTFDIVLCAFDSINHLLRFSDWKRVFRSAKAHMHEHSVFIFDANTLLKFENYSEETPLVEHHDEDFSIFDVSRGKHNIWNLDIRFFKQVEKNLYQETNVQIQERTFPITQVKDALKEVFGKIQIKDETGNKLSSKTETAYFICRL